MRVNPSELSDYHPTHNKAIDMVAACVGHSKKYTVKILAAIVLKPTAFMLFVKGIEVMGNKEVSYDEQNNLTFEGIKILKGGNGMIEFMRPEYIANKFKINPTA